MSSLTQDFVFAEADRVPASITKPLKAHISGPHAKLVRYAVTTERELGLLGDYDHLADNDYAWPNKPAGSMLDLDYTKIYVKDALLLYFSDNVSADSAIAPVSGYKDRVRSDSVAFKENGDYPRSSLLLDRDVAINDTVYVRGSISGTVYDRWSYVKDFAGEALAATVGTATAESTNKPTQGFALSIDRVGGPENCVTPNPDGTLYDGLADGDIDETYTVEVTTGSSDQDFSTAICRVTSASGNDDVTSVAPQASGDMAVGTRGLKLSFDLTPGASCSSAADLEEVAPTDLIAGQKWRIHVQQEFTPPTATSSGTFTGETGTTYIVEVTTGATFNDGPKITVSTTTGVDASGPTTVSAIDSAVAMGTLGALISFAGTAMCKGDRYLVEVTSEDEGALQTLVLGHNLPDELLAATDLDLKLYIKQTKLTVDKQRADSPPDLNWDAGNDTITVKAGLVAYDSTWTNNEVEQALPVTDGNVYVEYRAWLTTYVGKIGELSDPTLVTAALGAVHPDNPLSYGVWLALQNSNGVSVKFTAVADPTALEDWQEVLEFVSYREELYNLVPLTFTKEVQDAFALHISEQSATFAGVWRAGFFSFSAIEAVSLVDASLSSDEEVVLATLLDDPEETGTQYSYFRITSDNAQLITTFAARKGDTARFLYTTDGFGGESYTEFTIEEIVNETDFRVTTPHTASAVTPQKIEIWRNYTKDEIVTAAKARALTYASKRICLCWPDQLDTTVGSVAGYFGCAAEAGLRSAIAPHRGLRDVPLIGFTGASRTTEFLSTKQIRNLGEGRVFVIADDSSGDVFAKYSVTTADPSNVSVREEAARIDIDAVAYAVFSEMQPYLSKNNTSPQALSRARTQLQATLEFLKSSGQTDELGALLLEGTVVDVRYDFINKDRLVVVILVTQPFPFSKEMDLSIIVS